MNNNALISVCIPTFNRKEFLFRAVKSVLNQTYKNFEIVVVDDGSDFDVQLELQNKFKDNRIKVFRNEKNKGRPFSRNRCIKESCGEYILWLDDDDFLEPETLRSYLHLIKVFPDVEISYGNLKIIGQSEYKYIKPSDFYKDKIKLLKVLTTKGSAIPNPGTIVKRSLYKQFGDYDLNLKRAQDYEFWIRTSLYAVFKKNEKVVVNYTVHEGNISSMDKFQSYFMDLSYESYAVRKNLNKNNIDYLLPFDATLNLLYSCNDILNSIYYSLFFRKNLKNFNEFIQRSFIKLNDIEKASYFSSGNSTETLNLYQRLVKKLMKYYKLQKLNLFKTVTQEIEYLFGYTWITSYYSALFYKNIGKLELAKKYALLSFRTNPFSQESVNLVLQLGIPVEEISNFYKRVLTLLNDFENGKEKVLSQFFPYKEALKFDSSLYCTG